MACESQNASFIFFACFVTEAFLFAKIKVCRSPKGAILPSQGVITPGIGHISFLS